MNPSEAALEGYFAHKKQHPPGTLQKVYAQGPMVAPGGGAVAYERGTPVENLSWPCAVDRVTAAPETWGLEVRVYGYRQIF